MILRRIIDFTKSVDRWLLAAIVLGGSLRFNRLGDYDNTYYTATVGSSLTGFKNFFFASFDPLGIVSVDKPPISFWFQSIFASIFGLSAWSVTLPQAIVGTLAIAVIYIILKQHFGRLAAVSASLILAVLPASVVIDSRNEPDSLLSFTLLLAAVSIIRSVQSGNWKWLLVFAILMGVAFNIKMFVAFIPLPIFATYYLVSSQLPFKRVLIYLSSTLGLLFLISMLWITIVSFTPSENRPYVGSTQNNSIWTLVFEYNGLNRFTSFIGPRRQITQQPPQPDQGTSFVNRQSGQQNLGIGGAQNSQGSRPISPQGGSNVLNNAQPLTIDVPGNTGILGLLNNPLANQLGWLLPLGILSTAISLSVVLTEGVYRNPASIFHVLRSSPAISQSFLWGGWLLIGTFVFGLANATTTHPYYLVGLSVPLAASLGIALKICFDSYRSRGVLSWILIFSVIGTSIYQVYGSKSSIQDGALAVLMIVMLVTLTISCVSLWKGFNNQPLSIYGLFVMVSILLLIPIVSSLNAETRIGMPSMGGLAIMGLPQANQQYFYNRPDQMELNDTRITNFLLDKSQPEKITLAGLNAREVSPYIIQGVPAISIGGFSGNDPIFDLVEFESISMDKGPLYFLTSGSNRIDGRRSSNQNAILEHVLFFWIDISTSLGLPQNTLYANPQMTFDRARDSQR